MRDVQAGRYARQLKNALDLKGLDDLAVSNNVNPFLQLGNFDDLRFRIYRDELTFRAGFAQAAVAAQSSVTSLAFQTPAGDGTTGLELRGIQLGNPEAAPTTFVIGLYASSTPAEALQSVGILCDRRKRYLNTLSNAALYSGTAAGPAIASPTYWEVPAGQGLFIGRDQLPFLMQNLAGPASFALKVVNNTVNQRSRVTFVWVEFPFEQSEL
jgi:hypothetical protein